MGGRAPALVPALALVAGVGAAREVGRALPLAATLPAVVIPLVAVGLLCLAVHARLGTIALAAALGWTAGGHSVVSDAPLLALDPRRPVEVRARVSGDWSRSEAGWRAWLKIDQLRQGERTLTRTPRLRAHVAAQYRPPAGGLTLRGYLRPPSALRNGTFRGEAPWRLSVSSPRLVAVDRQGGWKALREWTIGFREAVEQRLDRRHAAGSALARSLVLGDVSRLPPRQLTALRRLGLGHLVAVSGLHLALLIGLVWLAAGWMGRPGRLLAASAALVLYGVLVGFRPSLMRASLMTGCALASLASQRRPGPLNSWAVATGSIE